MYKIDLHTHSTDSPDGSLSIDDYRKIIGSKKLNYVAITDHNSIDYAKKIKQELGDYVIIGEEIMTLVGEIIGLYLSEVINPNLSLEDTVRQIKKQNGLVYIPHPLATIRKGIGLENLRDIIEQVDIVECYNGRSFNSTIKDYLIDQFEGHDIVCASGSDSHGKIGFGRTMTITRDIPKRENLVMLLRDAKYVNRPAGLISRLYPTINRFRNSHDK